MKALPAQSSSGHFVSTCRHWERLPPSICSAPMFQVEKPEAFSLSATTTFLMPRTSRSRFAAVMPAKSW